MAVLGHRPFFARPDKRGSVLLRASSFSSFLLVLVFLGFLVLLASNV